MALTKEEIDRRERVAWREYETHCLGATSGQEEETEELAWIRLRKELVLIGRLHRAVHTPQEEKEPVAVS